MSTVYQLVCGADGLTYFSPAPCRAGCVEGYEGENSNEEENKVHSTCYIFGLVMVDIPVEDLLFVFYTCTYINIYLSNLITCTCTFVCLSSWSPISTVRALEIVS